MAKQHRSSKLAVILHADIVGSTQLVHQDEQLAHERIQETFRRFGDIITRYKGRVRELRGDALLAEFERVSGAVSAALAFQGEQADYLRGLRDGIEPIVRVGIAMGEVVIADNTITGAGVVLAQRLEQLAEPGNVVIQALVHETIPKRYPFAYTDLGEHQVKGFDQPVQAYSVVLQRETAIPTPEKTDYRLRNGVIALVSIAVIAGGAALLWMKPWQPLEESASLDSIAYPLPDRPSLAVLPFTNMSGHPEQEYFADGMAEDLITDLSKLSGLFVISRNSSFNFRGKSISIKQVAKELGVRYVLEGSVRRDGNQVRINAQLIDASDEGHLWANRYDGSLENIFSFQDSITAQIVSALKVSLLDGESLSHSNEKTYDVTAHDAYLRGLAAYNRDTPKDNGAAALHLLNAIEIDSGYSAAYTALAKVYARGSLRNFRYQEALGMSLSQLITNLLEVLGNPAVTPDADYHTVRSLLMLRKRQYTEAIAEAKRSLAISPNNVDALEALAEALIYNGELGEGVKAADLAIRQSPSLNSRLMHLKGVASYVEGDLSSSISLIEQAIKQSPKSEFYAVLAAAYQEQGLSEDARAAMESFAPTLQVHDMTWPNLGEATQHYPFSDRNVLARFAASLVKAGATDTGYLPLVSSNRLNAAEVRDLLFGSSIKGVRWWWYDSFTQSRDEEGVSSHPEKSALTGRYGDSSSVSRFIGDSLCEYFSGIGDVCVSVFKMPEKDSLHTRRGDYVMVTDFGPAPFRVQ